MSSRKILVEVERAWKCQADEWLGSSRSVDLAEAEDTARQWVERCVFLTLCAGCGIAPSERLATGLLHAGGTGGAESETRPWESILTKTVAIDTLEAVHLHLLSRRLHRDASGKLLVRSSRSRRRRQGIYYTPDYIAQYLARRCLSAACDGELPNVVDPACGCGRFLLAAAGQLRAAGRRANEVAGCLYGCDLDEEAVLVARRMLWLALVTESTDSAEADWIAGTLARNVVCGNSLTGNPWPEGPTAFGVVLGNPPYRRELGTKELLDAIAGTEFGRRYRAPRMDLWYYFLHRGIELLSPAGRLGFIVGAYWAAGAGANRLIQTLRESVHVEEVFQLDRLRVFSQVGGHHMMLVVAKRVSRKPTTVRVPVFEGRADARPFVEGTRRVQTFTKGSDELFRHGKLDLEPPAGELLERLAQYPALKELGEIRQGIAENPACVTAAANRKHGKGWKVGQGVFALRPDELDSLELGVDERRLIRPYHDLCDLGRYDRAAEPSLRLVYSTRETWWELSDFPGLARHLERFRPIMEARRETVQGIRRWWQLHWPRERRLWESPKLIALQMGSRPALVPATAPTYVPFSANVFLPKPGLGEHLNYFAALLNSRLHWKWFRHHAKRRGLGLEINGHVLARAPIRRIDFDSSGDVAAHGRLVQLVDRLIDLSQQRRAGPEAESLTRIDAEWESIDTEIDTVVFRLYGLTPQGIDPPGPA